MIKNLIFPLIVILTVFISCTNTNENKETKQETKQEVVNNSNEDKIFEKEKEEYINKGMLIAKSTGKILKGKLSEAVDKGGLKSGIDVCNNIAQKLMDSLSTTYGVKIKRTSIKLRNGDDKPDHQELSVLSQFHKMHQDGVKLKPQVRKFNEGIRFYAPIFIDDVCLNCHGSIGGKLKADNYRVIKGYYPNDEAINYKKGDLRAIWSITFEK